MMVSVNDDRDIDRDGGDARGAEAGMDEGMRRFLRLRRQYEQLCEDAKRELQAMLHER